jgi:hypothetical protein
VPAGDPLYVDATWTKRSYSAYNGNCVEVANFSGDGVGVRDSKEEGGTVLLFRPGDWQTSLDSPTNTGQTPGEVSPSPLCSGRHTS